MTQSFRKGDWLLHCSAVRRSIPLFFGFDRPNYKRWVPLYLEDCLSVQTKYPELSKHFIDGGFVGSQTSRCGSSLPFDQFLEKAYNKPPKVSGGIIGMTRRKENVTKWELNKHEKKNSTSISCLPFWESLIMMMNSLCITSLAPQLHLKTMLVLIYYKLGP